MSWQRQVDGDRIVTCVIAEAGRWGQNSHLCHGRGMWMVRHLSWHGHVDGDKIVTCVMAEAGGWGDNSHLCHGRGRWMGRE